MTTTHLPNKRINLEIIFWDVTILLITFVRHILVAMPARPPFDRKWLKTLLKWLGWILAGLTMGWFLGIASL